MPKKMVSCSKQTDTHSYTAVLWSSLLQAVADDESFLVGCKRNRKKNYSLGQSNTKFLYLVLAALPGGLLKCVTGKVFFRLVVKEFS